MRRQPAAVARPDGEVLLVMAHGGSDDLRRQVQERWVHVSQDWGRPLGQARHLFQQAIVFDQFQAALATELAAGLEDPVLPVLGVEHHEMTGQGFAVLIEVARPERPARAHEAVALGDLVGGEALDLERDDLAVEDAEDALDRPNPA